ncbi:MAG: HEAT repeat domain-containing protein [Archangium sp.]|nr:HEAT repeat domain-containing protein [Archangium sp.]
MTGLLLALALTAAPKKGPAAIGSAKEDEPCPVAISASAGDATYLRALAWAFEPAPQEVRAQAIEDLGFLGDTRALNALAVLSLDANALISKAAIRAVGTMRHPRAEEILGNIVRHPTVSLTNRQFALSLIPFQNTATALRFVHFTARQVGGNADVTQLARSLAATLPSPTAEDAVAPIPQVQTAPAGTMAPAPFPSGNVAGDSK